MASGITDSGSPLKEHTTSNDTVECPVCDEPWDDSTQLYRHLQVQHRKSTLAKALINATNRVDETQTSAEEVLAPK